MAIGTAAAQPPADDPAFARIVAWGSRPWEQKVRPALSLEERDRSGRLERTFYFPLEAEDLGTHPPHSPASRRERVFAEAVARILREQGPAPWPVYVFSACYEQNAGLDALSLATTRRMILREAGGEFGPAVAILLNAKCWESPARIPIQKDDRLCELVARHELFHARRAWLRAAEIKERTDAIQERLRGEKIAAPGRANLELMVRDGLAAEEEIEAVDASGSFAMLPQYMQGFMEYREQNKQRYRKAIKAVLGLFPSVNPGETARNLEKWATGLLHIQPRPR
jgi:hypothetical protein